VPSSVVLTSEYRGRSSRPGGQGKIRVRPRGLRLANYDVMVAISSLGRSPFPSSPHTNPSFQFIYGNTSISSDFEPSDSSLPDAESRRVPIPADATAAYKRGP
jgi:hypothetical protein